MAITTTIGTETSTTTATQLAEVREALANHDRLKNSWFWKDNGNANARSYRQKQVTINVTVYKEGHVYRYETYVSITRKNFHYKGVFSKDGVLSNVRLFKKLEAQLISEEAIK